jgi:hypothetical protein
MYIYRRRAAAAIKAAPPIEPETLYAAPVKVCIGAVATLLEATPDVMVPTTAAAVELAAAL